MILIIAIGSDSLQRVDHLDALGSVALLQANRGRQNIVRYGKQGTEPAYDRAQGNYGLSEHHSEF